MLAEEAVMAIRIDSVKNPPWGIAGGMAGGVGRIVVNPGTNHERPLQPLSDGNVLKKGDVLRIETGGGGGHGHPFDRPADAVLEDVAGGFISMDGAPAALRRRHRRRVRSTGPPRRNFAPGVPQSKRSTVTRMSTASPETSLCHRHRYRWHFHRHRPA